MRCFISMLSIILLSISSGGDGKKLEKFLENGELVFIEKPDEKGRQFITGIAIISAPIEVVWDVITDFNKYNEFMPQADGIRTLEKKEDIVDAEINIKFTFSVISTKVSYVMRHRLKPPRKMEGWSIRGDVKDAETIWELIPIKDGRATMASYRHWSDLSSIGILMRYLLKEQPSLGIAVHVSTATLTLRAIKQRAEEKGTSHKQMEIKE